MNKAKLVGMICKERLQTLEEKPPNFWNKESPHTLFNLSSILRKKLDTYYQVYAFFYISTDLCKK